LGCTAVSTASTRGVIRRLVRHGRLFGIAGSRRLPVAAAELLLRAHVRLLLVARVGLLLVSCRQWLLIARTGLLPAGRGCAVVWFFGCGRISRPVGIRQRTAPSLRRRTAL